MSFFVFIFFFLIFRNDLLLVRKLRKNEGLKESKWVYEIGGTDSFPEENALLKASSQNV